MHKLYELKEMLCTELEEYGGKDKLDITSLEVVDKLAHALKNVEKIIMMHEEEEEYSERGGSYERGGGGSYEGGSYARGGRGGGRYSRERGNRYSREGGSYARGQRRDSRGRYSRDMYSRDGDMVEELRELMQEAPDDRTRQEFERLIQKIEGM